MTDYNWADVCHHKLLWTRLHHLQTDVYAVSSPQSFTSLYKFSGHCSSQLPIFTICSRKYQQPVHEGAKVDPNKARNFFFSSLGRIYHLSQVTIRLRTKGWHYTQVYKDACSSISYCKKPLFIAEYVSLCCKAMCKRGNCLLAYAVLASPKIIMSLPVL